MRIWDIFPEKLCRNHLLGEHRELHALWVILTQNKKGYSFHPETKRWKGRLPALYNRHEELAKKMKKRTYNHQSPLSKNQVKGRSIQDKYVNSIQEQIQILKNKGCNCKV